MLRDSGLSDEQTKELVRAFASMTNVTDQELIRLSDAPTSPTLFSPFRKQLAIWRHQIAHWWNHGKGFQRIIYAAAWGTLLWQAVAKAALGWFGVATAILIIGVKLKVVIGEMSPKHLPMLNRTLDERQLLLTTLLRQVQLWKFQPPNEDQRHEFQVDVLKLIVSLVRDHRSDLKGKMIFANLLSERGDQLVVIARADTPRQVPKAYSREQCSVACRAFETGVAQATGDLYAEEGTTDPGKSYNSVLAIPIKVRDKVLGVVSIDSELKHHFYNYRTDLENLLAPYVQLLASAIIEDQHVAQVVQHGNES